MEIGRGIQTKFQKEAASKLAKIQEAAQARTPSEEMRENAAKMTGSSGDLRFPLSLSQGELQHYMTFEISEFKKIAYQPGDVATQESSVPNNPHTTISLYIPEQIAMKSTAAYENMGLNFASELFVDNQGETGGIMTAAGDFLKTMGIKGLTATGDFFANEAGEIGLQNKGMASNAGKVVLFRGIDFRTFSFSYKFSPRNHY